MDSADQEDSINRIRFTEETERRLNTMCNLSEVVLERGIEQGQRQLIEKMLKKGKTAEEIADLKYRYCC